MSDDAAADPPATHMLWSLFEDVRTGNEEATRRFIADYGQFLGDMVEDLARVPEVIRDDEAMVGEWVQFIVFVASLLADQGDSRLLRRLTGPDDNPIERWNDLLFQAQQLRAEGRYEASDAVIGELLPELRSSRGTAVTSLIGKTLGLAGANAFDRGDNEAALRLTDEALRECERSGDTEGVAIYAQNLATIAAAAQEQAPSPVRRHLVAAQRLHDAGRLAEALEQVRAAVAALDDDDGPDNAYRAKAHGLLGMILFRLGDLTAALDHTRKALTAGQESGDPAAVEIYGANLAVIERAMSPTP
jgi:tetratricopeptide (TPR) repeat protein